MLLRGTVEALLPDHEVYITDWTDARRVPIIEGRFGVEDYTDYVIETPRWLGPGAHVMAVCQPSVPALVALSVMSMGNDPCLPLTATLMGGPIDTRRNPTQPNNLATSRPIEWFERNVIFPVPPPYPGVLRHVYPGFLQLTGFMTMNFSTGIWTLISSFSGISSMATATGWTIIAPFTMNISPSSTSPRNSIWKRSSACSRSSNWPAGPGSIAAWRIDPSAITKTALLCVEGERDDISGLGQTAAALDLCTRFRPSGSSTTSN